MRGFSESFCEERSPSRQDSRCRVAQNGAIEDEREWMERLRDSIFFCDASHSCSLWEAREGAGWLVQSSSVTCLFIPIAQVELGRDKFSSPERTCFCHGELQPWLYVRCGASLERREKRRARAAVGFGVAERSCC